MRVVCRRPPLTSRSLKPQAVHLEHGRLVGRLAREHASEERQRIGVIAVHVLDDARRHLGERVGASGRVGAGFHPVHRGEAADRAEVDDLEPPEGEVVEVDPGRGSRLPRQIVLA